MDGDDTAADDGGLLPPAGEPATCQRCGSAPAIDVQLRRHVGMLYVMRTETVDARLCRGCGTATYRSMTNRTLVTGWWGLISFVMNFATIAQNVAAGRRLAALPPPAP